MGYVEELKRLSLKTRNRVRPILALETREAIALLDSIRRSATAGVLAQVDRVFWAMPNGDAPLIPSLFPSSPQTAESFYRLEPVSLSVQVGVIEQHVRSIADKVRALVDSVSALNRQIVDRDLSAADATISQIVAQFGHSHFLLRKAALVRALSPNGIAYPGVETVLSEAGLQKNNIIMLAVVDCYQEEKDFLSMKRSIMNLPDRGSVNKFTRDMSRVPFHPISRDDEDLRDQLQSALQSSLLDALVTLKVNAHEAPLSEASSTREVLTMLEAASPGLDEIAMLQPATDSESEHIFYKRSSAWLECSEIVRYRMLLDHFYDSPEAHYFEITPTLLGALSDSVEVLELNALSASPKLTKHQSPRLEDLQRVGTASRSALFNYSLHLTQGYTSVDEPALVDLMGVTRDLSRTIPAAFATNLAKSAGSDISKLVLYLLIAKRSRNERDDHLLRKTVQQIATTHFNGQLLPLVVYLESRSSAIAIYAYEIFTEDFIARLYDLIDSPSDVIDTRAALHRWMGQHTGDKAYVDRARTLLIDHQINRIRNEIDDNRIYVDVARFHEWVGEELVRDLDTALSSIGRNANGLDSTDSVLSVLVEQCYATFCSHKAFGIASYLGRRIRHGTFKGHLYSQVVGIEREPRFATLLADPNVKSAWLAWKSRYEAEVDTIIRERLHVESASKRDGLMKPRLLNPQKSEILLACIRALVKDYSENKTSAAAVQLITEYCWRLAEVDLRAFNAYLKGQQRSLIDADGLNELKHLAPPTDRQAAVDLYGTVARAIRERLMTMQTWFKRPLNVAPKASLPLLYKAVVEEVRTAFPGLQAPLDMDPSNDIELFGGAYHVLYDSFYVVVYNAAKHGKTGGLVEPTFSIVLDGEPAEQFVVTEISSEIRDDEDEQLVTNRLKVDRDDDVDNAQVFENRSGIPKLYHLQMADPNFRIRRLECADRRVTVVMTYRLEH